MDVPAATRLYIDFDGFFAAVEEQARPVLRGRPIGVVPMGGAENTCVIAANAKAKTFGVKTGTKVGAARRLCRGICLVPATPGRYVEAHNRIVDSVGRVLPVDAVCSIDEMCCTPAPHDRPEELAAAIKAAVRDRVGEFVTCSIGVAPGRLLAKVASEMDKPDGLTVLPAESLPGRLAGLQLRDIAGIGSRMAERLARTGIRSVTDLWNSSPLQLKGIWGVTGYRFWHALHGHQVEDVAGMEAAKSIEHSKVLAPELRSPAKAYRVAQILAIRVARRLRRGGQIAGCFSLSASLVRGPRFSRQAEIGTRNSDIAMLRALGELWPELERHCTGRRIIKVRISLGRLAPENDPQQSLFEECPGRRREKSLADAMDLLNARYGKTVVGYGILAHERKALADAKVAFTKVPEMAEFR